MTGRENIELNGLLLGLSKRQIAQREASIIEFAELAIDGRAGEAVLLGHVHAAWFFRSLWKWTLTFS